MVVLLLIGLGAIVIALFTSFKEGTDVVAQLIGITVVISAVVKAPVVAKARPFNTAPERISNAPLQIIVPQKTE